MTLFEIRNSNILNLLKIQNQIIQKPVVSNKTYIFNRKSLYNFTFYVGSLPGNS